MHGPSSGCAPAAICSAVPSTLHFSGSTIELGALARGVADQAIGSLEIAIDVFGRVELDCAGAHRVHLS